MATTPQNPIPGVVGQSIVDVRPMTRQEVSDYGWEDFGGYSLPLALVLDNGSLLIPSQDLEGNGPGALFIRADDGDFTLSSAG